MGEVVVLLVGRGPRKGKHQETRGDDDDNKERQILHAAATTPEAEQGRNLSFYHHSLGKHFVAAFRRPERLLETHYLPRRRATGHGVATPTEAYRKESFD
jgi:hypothetical protein